MLLIRALRRTPMNLVARHTALSGPVRAPRFTVRDFKARRQHRSTSTSTGATGPEAEAESESPSQKYRVPPRLLIYHTGSGRISFIACLKLTTLFIFTFFGFVVTPTYYRKEGISPTVARSAACAVVPVAFVAYITSPFVLFMHLRVPPSARYSEVALSRYLQTVVKTMPPQAELDITTMSLIAKPRLSTVRLSELMPVNKRLGVVTLARDTAPENATRKWYMFPAVGNFSIQSGKGTLKYSWIWEAVWEKLHR